MKNKLLILVLLVCLSSSCGREPQIKQRFFIISYSGNDGGFGDFQWITNGEYVNRNEACEYLTKDRNYKILNPILICITEVSKEDYLTYSSKDEKKK